MQKENQKGTVKDEVAFSIKKCRRKTFYFQDAKCKGKTKKNC